MQIMVDPKGPENLEYLRYLDNLITEDAKYVTEIISRTAMPKEELGENWT